MNTRTTRLLALLDSTEQVLLSLVSRLGPWLAPIAPAYFIARAGLNSLDAPPAVAWAMGISVEAVGVAAFYATLKAWTWNREHRAGVRAPVRLGLALVAVYLATGIGLAVGVELWPQLVPAAPAAFFILAGVAYAVLGMISDQAGRQDQFKEDKRQKREEAAFRKLAKVQGLTVTARDVLLAQSDNDPLVAIGLLTNGWQLAGQSTNERPVVKRWADKQAFLADPDRPELTRDELATLQGVSTRTARRWLAAVDKLAASGGLSEEDSNG